MISEDVIDTLAALFAMRGVSKHIRSNNDPEFSAKGDSEVDGATRMETL